MDKRYQVFVSSTYEDMQAERQEVMHALLELDCIPAGMELFPAANEDQWTLIKQVIDDCDYYIVIIGGRYGSTDKDGVSYTEKEYRYAIEKGKPVIGFLHRHPEELPAKKTDSSEKNQESLKEFRELVRKRMCQFWDNPSDLGSKVSRSLIKLIKQHPAVGWVRADELPSENVNQELLNLRKQIDELQQELAQAQTEAPKGTEGLASGDDIFETQFTFERSKDRYRSNPTRTTGKIQLTWDEIFYTVSPLMIDEAADVRLKTELTNNIRDKSVHKLRDQFNGEYLSGFRVHPDSFHTIIVQLRALGLITKSVRNRSVKDKDTYWKLTPYGESVMTRLRAIKKKT